MLRETFPDLAPADKVSRIHISPENGHWLLRSGQFRIVSSTVHCSGTNTSRNEGCCRASDHWAPTSLPQLPPRVGQPDVGLCSAAKISGANSSNIQRGKSGLDGPCFTEMNVPSRVFVLCQWKCVTQQLHFELSKAILRPRRHPPVAPREWAHGVSLKDTHSMTPQAGDI
jgi:hypothetical protein